MTQINCGPYAVIDGPPPLPPRYGLLQAAASLVSDVRFVTSPAGPERWLNGAKVLPYPHHAGATHSRFDASGAATKEVGDAGDEAQFYPVTVYVSDQCSSYRVDDNDAYIARINANLAAVEGAVIAHALLTGDGLPAGSPRLSDGEGEFPEGNTAVSLPRALAALEGAIARSRRAGVIHMSPVAASILSGSGHILVHDPLNTREENVLRTVNGTLVIPDQGYIEGATPAPEGAGTHPVATPLQAWLYASGSIEVRRTETFVNPPTLEQALDTGLSASVGGTNVITYQAERYYLVSWDNTLQAAVLATVLT